jgi:hemoglobin
MSENQIPTLYQWAGDNLDIFKNLVETFYDLAVADPLLRPLFEDMPPAHRENVALWFAEVFKGPKIYSSERGNHAHMIKHHLNLQITEAQRSRWTQLMVIAADQVQLPNDPEFRSAFVAYVEWGTRMALMYSQPGQHAPSEESPMPTWGWGEVKPYIPEE